MKIVIEPGGVLPIREHPTDAGLDLRAPVQIEVPANLGRSVVDTKIRAEIPEGHVGILLPKSGLMKNKGILSFGVIDAGYTGTIKAVLINTGAETAVFNPGEKVTQMVIVPCITPEIEIAEELQKTQRGDRGFGSTGR